MDHYEIIESPMLCIDLVYVAVHVYVGACIELLYSYTH